MPPPHQLVVLKLLESLSLVVRGLSRLFHMWWDSKTGRRFPLREAWKWTLTWNVLWEPVLATTASRTLTLTGGLAPESNDMEAGDSVPVSTSR